MPTPPKRKLDSARRANRIIQQRTLLLLALLGIGTFLLLFAQLYKLQIKQHDELKTLAVRQQTLRTTVEASRGTIYDKTATFSPSPPRRRTSASRLSTSPKTNRIRT